MIKSFSIDCLVSNAPSTAFVSTFSSLIRGSSDTSVICFPSRLYNLTGIPAIIPLIKNKALATAGTDILLPCYSRILVVRRQTQVDIFSRVDECIIFRPLLYSEEVFYNIQRISPPFIKFALPNRACYSACNSGEVGT